MELGKLIFAAVVFLIILIFIMFPEARTLFSGITRVFIKDMASTPEGAAAIYSEKIDQAQDRYNKADNAYRIAAGKLSNAQRDMKNLKAKLEKVESECESLVKANKMDLAQLKADEHEEIISDIERYKELIKAYEDAANTAKEAQEMCEKNLRKLKRESKEVVENMKVKKQLQEVYDDMDELKSVTATDKLLDMVCWQPATMWWMWKQQRKKEFPCAMCQLMGLHLSASMPLLCCWSCAITSDTTIRQ